MSCNKWLQCHPETAENGKYSACAGLTAPHAPLGSSAANDLQGAPSGSWAVAYSHGGARLAGCGGKGARIIDRSSRTPRAGIAWRRRLAGLVAAALLGAGASVIVASPMPDQIPGGGQSVAPQGSGIAPQPVATAPAPDPAAAATAPAATAPAAKRAAVLRYGMRGADVKRLQRALRKARIRVPVDGRYGKKTRAGVRIFQRRMKVRATGVANAKVLKRLRIKVRTVATSPGAFTGSARYLRVFPVVGDYSYSNDFGAPRHQGSHQGNDIIGKTGMTLVACTDGTIKRMTRSETGLGGIWIWLEDAEGNEYYYAHMQSISPELSAGSKVTAGQVVGTMGMTGDARGTVPHLHFEIRPNGGGSINPFNELRAVDPQRK